MTVDELIDELEKKFYDQPTMTKEDSEALHFLDCVKDAVRRKRLKDQYKIMGIK